MAEAGQPRRGFFGHREPKLGPVVREGQHPLSFVDPPPAHEPFAVASAEVVIRANGFPAIIAAGACPDLAGLDGWVLACAVRSRQLVFGGLHPKVRDGADAPFKPFFALSAPASVYGHLAAAIHVDVVFVRDPRPMQAFVFRFVDWARMQSASAREDCYGRASAESGGAP